jgi:hypothetical protein
MYFEGIQQSRSRVNLFPLAEKCLYNVKGNVILRVGCRKFRIAEHEHVLRTEKDEFADNIFDVHDMQLYAKMSMALQSASYKRSCEEKRFNTPVVSSKRRKFNQVSS